MLRGGTRSKNHVFHAAQGVDSVNSPLKSNCEKGLLRSSTLEHGSLRIDTSYVCMMRETTRCSEFTGKIQPDPTSSHIWIGVALTTL